jgi:hypothetical protein
MVRTYLDAGQNPPRGAIVTYRLGSVPAEPITLTFKDAKGEEIRSFSSRKTDDPAIAKERRVPAKQGGNRFVWDLRHAPATKIEGDDPAAKEPVPGPFVAPGTYTVTLKVGEVEQTQSFTVVKPASVTTSQEDLDAQHDLLVRIHQQIDRTAKTINRMRDLRLQLDGWAKRAEKLPDCAEIATKAAELRDRSLEIEKTILIPGLRDGWADRINNGARLFEKLCGLPAVPAMGDYKPTDAAEEAFKDFTARIEAEIARFDAFVESELPSFNEQIKSANLGAICAIQA